MDNQLLETVQRWGKRNGFDEGQIATAQSMAWYYRANYAGDELPDSHWARLGVRAVRNGRDLPGCWTSPTDALHRIVQGSGMGQVMDRYPGPDTLAADREAFERMLMTLDDKRKQVVELKLAGVKNKEVASHLGLSEARISQLAREIVELCS